MNVENPAFRANPADVLRRFYDDVLNAAASAGIRFYTVEGQGIVVTTTGGSDAQGTLVSLAAETGGRSFLNGVGADTIAKGVLSDLSCYYLLSFKPGDFRVDEPLSVFVAVSRPKVDPCVQLRDVIPGATLGSGLFRYRVVLRRGSEEVASRERVFHVSDDPSAAPSAPAR